MSLSRWFRRSARPARTFRPALLPLEDRTVPSGFGLGGGYGHSTPGPATHLQVIVPENVQAGQTFEVKVEALDASNHIATSFADSVQLTTSDMAATGFPVTLNFKTSPGGIDYAQIKLATVGPEQIIAADTTNTSVMGDTETTNVTPAPVASKIVVVTPETAATGVLTPVTVEVLDQSGHLLRNFTGTVQLTSSDTSATATASRHTTAASVPITYTFTAQDHGEHTFLVTFNETAAATGTSTTVTASTPPGNNPTLSGQATLTVYPPTTATHFGVYVSPVVFSGQANAVEVEALNASNQVVSGYNGTVKFSLSTPDSSATISTTRNGMTSLLSGFTYQFTTGSGADDGKHTFWVTLSATGSQTLTVTDTTTSPLTGSEIVQVLTLPHHKGWYI